MSDKIPTSSRLDSLSRRSTPGARGGLKFKPKVVARRSKEERDADAPINAPESREPSHSHRGQSTRGRGSTRGGRGSKALAGTHLVQAGPLASGVSESNQSSFVRSATASPTPEFLSNLVKREATTRASSVGLSDEDEENDLSKININQEYKFSAEESELFPVRAPRAKTLAEQAKNTIKAEEIRSISPESITSDTSKEITPLSVKDEPLEKDITTILKEKDAELHKKLKGLELKTTNVDEEVNEELDAIEHQKNDHKEIVKKILEIDNKEESFLFLQLPTVLPKFELDTELEENIKPERVTSKVKTENSEEETQLEGEIGKLRVHKSGKITMKIGNIVMDVTRGSETRFLQDVVLLNKDEQNEAFLLGHLEDKLVVTPRLT